MTKRNRFQCNAVTMVVAAFLMTGCASTDPGVDPPRDAFYFPTSLALDPIRPVLYVTNSNADLNYNGGTLMALDLRALPDDISQLRQTIGAKKLRCTSTPLDPTRWVCGAEQFIMEKNTRRIGDYPGDLKVSGNGKRLYLPVRGADHLMWADVQGSANSAAVELTCSRSTTAACVNGDDKNCRTWDCDDAYRVNFAPQLDRALPPDPYVVVINELAAVHIDGAGQRRTCRDGLVDALPAGPSHAVSCTCDSEPLCRFGDPSAKNCCVPPPGMDHLYVMHLLGGEVSFFIARESGVALRDIRGGLFNRVVDIDNDGRADDFVGVGLAIARPGDAQSHVYATSQYDDQIASFVVRDNQQILPAQRIQHAAVSAGTGGRIDMRTIATANGGKQLYVLNQMPPAVVAFDIGDPDENTSSTHPRWVSEVCANATILKLGPDATQPQNPAAQWLYVVCYRSEEMMVIDSANGKIVNVITTGKGPNAIDFDLQHKRAFITNFAENTIGVINLDPSHETFLKMVMRIGQPTALVKVNSQ